MANPRQRKTREQERNEARYLAERSPGNIFHDSVIIVSVFATYLVFLFMGKMGESDEDSEV